MKYRILVIDDEDSGRQALRILINKNFWAYTASLDFAFSYEEAELRMSNTDYDIIFLDINLKGKSGFELIKIKPNKAKVIYVTAYSEYLLNALRNQAFDYLVKPINEPELIDCFNRIIKENNYDEKVNKIQIKSKGITRIVPFKDILYIEGDGPYSIFYLENEKIKTAKTLKSIFTDIELSFVRIHKSFLVNRNYIKGYNMEKVILLNDTCLPVSRTGFRNLSGQ